MTQQTSTSNGLPVRSAVRAGRLRADQPDPPNQKRHNAPTRLTVAHFGVNDKGRVKVKK